MSHWWSTFSLWFCNENIEIFEFYDFFWFLTVWHFDVGQIWGVKIKIFLHFWISKVHFPWIVYFQKWLNFDFDQIWGVEMSIFIDFLLPNRLKFDSDQFSISEPLFICLFLFWNCFELKAELPDIITKSGVFSFLNWLITVKQCKQRCKTEFCL